MTPLNPEDWTPYWKRSTVTSFGNLFPDNYDGPIRNFWEKQLQSEINHILDICCGNGALTWLCHDILKQENRSAHITGIDFADIQPFKVLGKNQEDFPNIQFIGNTKVEDLSLADQSADLVISQYGIEYSNLEKSVPQVSRVLTMSGKMCFILHDKESTLIKGATNHLDDYKTVLNQIAIHDIALEIDDFCLQVIDPVKRKASRQHQEFVNRLSAAAARIKNLTKNYKTRSPIHLYLERLNQALAYSDQNKNIDRKALINQARDALNAHIERIDDLEEAALSASDREDLKILIENQSFTITDEGKLWYDEKESIGTYLIAERLPAT